jgi:hypothetical protein
MKELGITKGEWIYDDGYEGAFVYAKLKTQSLKQKRDENRNFQL